ncbi:MAG: hypothetical protein AB1546_16250, partial [bacterium]
ATPDENDEWSWDTANNRVEIFNNPAGKTITYPPSAIGLLQADGAITSWCAAGSCSFTCGANYCSNLSTPLPSKPDYVKFNGSLLTEDDAQQTGEWDWNPSEKQVRLFDNPSGATVTYTPAGESQVVCVFLYDACDQLISGGKWRDVPVMLELSQSPDSGKDISQNKPESFRGFKFTTVPNPPDALNSDLTPPDQTQVRGMLQSGMACVSISAEFAPSDDPQSPIKITPTYYDEDTGALTTLTHTGGADRPAYILIRPSTGIASGTTSISGFATVSTIFNPTPSAATQAIVFNPSWSKDGDEVALISRQTSPCDGDAAVGSDPYTEFNIYTMKYSGGDWADCRRLTKNSTDGVDTYGVAAWSETTWAPTNDKVVFAAVETTITGAEKLFWVSATGTAGAATGSQYNLSPSETAQDWYTLDQDAPAASTTLYVAEAPPYLFSTDSYIMITDFTNSTVKQVTSWSTQTIEIDSALGFDAWAGMTFIVAPISLKDMGQMITGDGDNARWYDPDWSPNDAQCDATYRDKLMVIRDPFDTSEDGTGSPPNYNDGAAAKTSDTPNIVYFSGSKDNGGLYRQDTSSITKITNFTGNNPWPLKPKWAPDCSKIAFISWDRSPTPDNPSPPSKTSVYIINLTDSGLGATATLPVSSLTATGVYQVYGYDADPSVATGPAYYPNWSADASVVSYSVDVNNILDLEQVSVGYDTLVEQIFSLADFDNYLEYVEDESPASGSVDAPQVVGRAGYNEFGMAQCPGNLTGSNCPNSPNFPFTFVMQTSANTGALRMLTLEDESYIEENGGLLFQNGIVTAVFPPGTVATDTVLYNMWPTGYCGGGLANEFASGPQCADPLNSDFIVRAGDAREFFPDGTNFKSYVRLIFHYCDNDDDGFVDAGTEGIKTGFTYNSMTKKCYDSIGGETGGGTIDVDSLAVYYWDHSQNKWIRMYGVVNRTKKTITIFSTHFSRYETFGFRMGFAPGAIVPLTMSNVHAYPSPWRSVFRPQEIGFNADQVCSDGPVDVSMKIYDIRGRLVRELFFPASVNGGGGCTPAAAGGNCNLPAFDANGGCTFARWDARSNSGREVASGVYLYIIHAIDTVNRTTFKQTGKIAVIH